MTHVRTPTGNIMLREHHERAVAFARKANSMAWLSMLLPAVNVNADGKEAP